MKLAELSERKVSSAEELANELAARTSRYREMKDLKSLRALQATEKRIKKDLEKKTV